MTVIRSGASSSLVRTEDSTTSILEFDDGKEQFGGEAKGREPVGIPKQRSGFYEYFLQNFPPLSEESIAWLVEKELEQIPGEDYAKKLLSGDLDISVRADAIDWIGEVQAHYNFGPLSAYLSINYMDRFLSAYELPEDNAWTAHLLCVACLSLAAKMEEALIPLTTDLQVAEAKYVFEADTIERMEFLVADTLKWRMQAVTPFSYVDYFLQKFNYGNSPTNSLVSRSVELILNTVRGAGFLRFRPSEIAAAAALLALEDIQIVEIENTLTHCIHVDKVRVLRCYEAIRETTLLEESSGSGSPSVPSIPHSPTGVSDASSLSYKSGVTTVGSPANSH